jgi:hypothetical protein
MNDAPHPLLLDLLEWLHASPRAYAELMAAWRTSCPRLTIWEDALEQGLVWRRRDDGGELSVELTPSGCALLRAYRVLPVSAAAGLSKEPTARVA